MKRIGISTRGLNQGSFAISTIIYHLTQNILALAKEYKDVEFVLFLNNDSNKALFDPAIPKQCLNIKNRFIWDQIWLPQALKRNRIDVALFMKGTIPLNRLCPVGVIIHDLGYFHNQLKPYKPLETVYMKWMLRISGKYASKIFAVSDHTKKEVSHYLHSDLKKVDVFYQDCSPLYQPVNDTRLRSQIRSLYGLPDDFIFCPASISPRKNYKRLLEAFSGLQDQIPHHLVITGGQTWQSRDILRKITADSSKRIHVLGNVPLEHMPALYSMAGMTVYPSLLEGFGLPILESFRCGCPVLTSNLASMPEVAGGAAYLVDPFSVDQISEGVYRLATNESLRQDLIAKGFERSKFFNWKTAARVIMDGLVSIT